VSREVQPGDRPDAPNGITAMVTLSLFIHVGLILALTAFALPAPSRSNEPPFVISLMHPPIDASSLPVIDGSRDAGPVRSVPQQVIAAPDVEEEEIEEAPPERSEPEPKREEPKPQPERQTPKVISTRSAAKPEETAPEPEPETPQQLRQRLESSQGVYTTKSTAGASEVSHHIALEGAGDPGGGGGAPDLFRNRLVTLIGQTWTPPRTRPGQVMEAIVEFTIESTPIDADAVNVNRERARVVDIVLVQSSGDARFDGAAEETVRRLRNLPPLPDYIKGSRLKVSCRFYFIGE